jgi:hypothetical protein
LELAGSPLVEVRFSYPYTGISRLPENFDRLACWFPEDSLAVLYSDGRGGGFRPIAQGSPGQKTATLLTFLLSYGDEPLLLDQPEDDLDNHLISDLIVTQLRRIKLKRQVIVVTFPRAGRWPGAEHPRNPSPDWTNPGPTEQLGHLPLVGSRRR